MRLKVFQKQPARAGNGGTRQAALKPPRPFTIPEPPAQHTAAQPGPAERTPAPSDHHFGNVSVGGQASAMSTGGGTGLPDGLKDSVEKLSGVPLGDVRVHYNSPAPARLNTLAHTQGTHIHIGRGQARHLAHEAWHVVQQKQGRVRPTMRTKAGVPINDDAGLEHEADVMGAKALSGGGPSLVQHAWKGQQGGKTSLPFPTHQAAPIQGFWPFSDSHAPPANLGGRVQALQNELATASVQQQADANWYATQQDNLAGVEADAHAWLRDHGHHATEDQRQEVANHLYALEDHHTALVGVQLAHNHPLWLPQGTSVPDRQRANQIWDDVQNDTGNITIDNSNQPVRDNTLADVAKLLQQPHGRDMLHELNADQGGDANRQVRIGGDWSGAFGAVGREHQQGSWATPYVANSRLNVRQGNGTPNQGIGSYVQVDRAHRVAETGAHGTGIPMPHYVTLGHELGHALHNLRGTWTELPQHNATFNNLDDTEQSLWSDPEEHANITQNENAIRAQHGLPTRAYHRPPKVVRATRMKSDLMNRADQARNDFPEHDAELRKIDPASPSFYTQQGIDEPEFYERANARISSLYRQRNLKRGALALGAGALALLGGYGIYRATR
jgi:hypothetical protein